MPDESAREPTAATGLVLVVEDNAAVRYAVARMLEQAGFVVLEAASAAACHEVLDGRHEPIALVVADLVMPVTGGRELVEELRRRYRGIKALYISGYLPTGTGVQPPEVPGEATIEKPFTREALMRKVRELLGSSALPSGTSER